MLLYALGLIESDVAWLIGADGHREWKDTYVLIPCLYLGQALLTDIHRRAVLRILNELENGTPGKVDTIPRQRAQCEC